MEHLKRFFLPLFLAALVTLSWLGPSLYIQLT